jgi:hypothetical protein
MGLCSPHSRSRSRSWIEEREKTIPCPLLISLRSIPTRSGQLSPPFSTQVAPQLISCYLLLHQLCSALQTPKGVALASATGALISVEAFRMLPVANCGSIYHNQPLRVERQRMRLGRTLSLSSYRLIPTSYTYGISMRLTECVSHSLAQQ